MIEKKTIIEQIEIARTGHVMVRFALLVMDDGVQDGEPKWHRSGIEPGGDVDAMIAAVNADIGKRLRASPIETDRVALLKSICKLVHTPELVKSYAAMAKVVPPAA